MSRLGRGYPSPDILILAPREREEPDPVAPVTDLIGPLLEATLDCADLAIEPRAGRAALYPGAEVAWDDCCEGQVYARLISMTPSGSPATGARVVSPCGVLIWAATIGVGVIRCAAVVDDQGRPPSPAALTANTLQMTSDMTAVAEAINCCLAPQVGKLQMLRWDPLGPEGGCVGGEWVFTVLTDNCRCP